MLKKEDFDYVKELDLENRVKELNRIKLILRDLSPFKKNPVDCVLWVKNENVKANDYNPNTVAPPEMTLLQISIEQDGYTQPIVTWNNEGINEVVDGFHRNRVGKECASVRDGLMGYLPVVELGEDRTDKKDRIASTIRHNRARGKHRVDAMSEIVLELKNRNWKNERIARELGMDQEEILRLCQISGLEDLFKDDDFSKAWVAVDENDDFIPLTDEVTEMEIEENEFRTSNTSDPERIFHTYDKWECQKHGFYLSKKEGMTKEECENEYAKFLSNNELFESSLKRVISEWKFSCEHYLTNKAMNRIAWLGQASVCLALGIPSEFRGGFYLLNEDQQIAANKMALKYLNLWLSNNNRKEISMEEALSSGRQVEIY